MGRISAQDTQVEILRRMSPAERLASAARLREDNLRLLEAGIRSREGDLAPEAMRLRVLEHILPQRLFARFYSGSR